MTRDTLVELHRERILAQHPELSAEKHAEILEATINGHPDFRSNKQVQPIATQASKAFKIPVLSIISIAIDAGILIALLLRHL